jgi:hypothetical protein
MTLTTDYMDGTDKKFTHEDQGCAVRQVFVDAIRVSIPTAHFVISSEAEGAVEKSLDFIWLVTRRHQDPPNLRSRD